MGASEKMRQILVNEGNLLGVGGIARPISVEVKPNNISALSRYSGRTIELHGAEGRSSQFRHRKTPSEGCRRLEAEQPQTKSDRAITRSHRIHGLRGILSNLAGVTDRGAASRSRCDKKGADRSRRLGCTKEGR